MGIDLVQISSVIKAKLVDNGIFKSSADDDTPSLSDMITTAKGSSSDTDLKTSLADAKKDKEEKTEEAKTEETKSEEKKAETKPEEKKEDK